MSDISPTDGTPTTRTYTRQEALRGFPDAPSADAACIAEKSYDEAQKGFRNTWLSRSFNDNAGVGRIVMGIVKEAWNKMDYAEQVLAPNDLRIMMAKSLPETKEGFDTQSELLKTTIIGDPSFAAWENPRTAKMLQEMTSDPVIADAREKWSGGELNESDRIHVAERIHEIHMRSMDAKPVEITGKYEPSKDGSITHGSYSNGKFWVNTHPDSTMYGNFDEFANTIVHEGTHAVQDQIGQRSVQVKLAEKTVLADLNEKSVASLSDEGREVYESERTRRLAEKFPDDHSDWNTELGADGKLREAAKMMQFNSNEGYSSAKQAGQENYETNPIEEHARQAGGRVAGFLKADPEKRTEMLNTLNGETKIFDESHEKRIEERRSDYKSNALCM